MQNLDIVISEIKNEIKVNEKGQSYISKKGLGRLLGVYDTNFSTGKWNKKLSSTLARNGFDVSTMTDDGVPDTAIPIIAHYYANEAKEKSLLASQVLMAFSAIGFRTWFQQISGYEKPKEETKPLSKIEKLRETIKSAQELMQLYEYANNKPGLNNIHNFALNEDNENQLPGLVTIDEIIDRMGKNFNSDERRVIGMYSATQYRNLTGKKPPQIQKRYTQPDGKRQYPYVCAYPIDFIPVIENAINLGFTS